MQESGLPEIISLICTSVISAPCVFTSQVSSGITLQSGCSLLADRREVLCFLPKFPKGSPAHLGWWLHGCNPDDYYILYLLICFVSCFVSTCVSLDNSFPSVRQEPILGSWKGFPFCHNIAEILSNLPKVIFVCLVAHSCPTLCNPIDCSPPGSSVHGILQVRILEWVALSSSRVSSQPRIEPSFHSAGRFCTS